MLRVAQGRRVSRPLRWFIPNHECGLSRTFAGTPPPSEPVVRRKKERGDIEPPPHEGSALAYLERDDPPAPETPSGKDVLYGHHVLTEVDKGIAKDLRSASSALDVVQHFVEHRADYDVVNLSTALHRVAVLTDSVKPWKREPLPRDAVNALVNDSIDRLREYASAFHQVTLDDARKTVGDSDAGATRRPDNDAALTSISTRAIASSAWSETHCIRVRCERVLPGRPPDPLMLSLQ